MSDPHQKVSVARNEHRYTQKRLESPDGVLPTEAKLKRRLTDELSSCTKGKVCGVKQL